MEVKTILERELEALFQKRAKLQETMQINLVDLNTLTRRIEGFKNSIAVLEDTEKGN